MRTPSQNAIERALEILWDDIGGDELTNDASAQSTSTKNHCREWTLRWTGLNHLKRHINHLLLGLARQNNAAAPINSLPDELTVAILMQSQPCVDDSFGDHHALASIQKRWWNIVKSYGCFWTQIDYGTDLYQVDQSLRRSQAAPLYIEVSHNKEEEDELGEFMELIEPHAHRWKSFTFSGNCFDVVQPYLEIPTPMLETLDLAADEIEEGEQLDLIGGPNLTRIELRGVIPTFSDRAFSNLTTLVLHNISTDYLTPQILIRLLTNNRGIQLLSLQDVFPGLDTFSDHDFIPSAPIVLPVLRRLHLSGLPTNHTLLILRTIYRTAAGEIIFRFFYDTETQGQEIFQELVTSRNGQPSILSSSLSIPGIPCINMSISDASIGVMCSSEPVREVVRVDLHGRNPSRLLRTNSQLLPFASSTFNIPIRLHYEVQSTRDGSDDLTPLLVGLIPTVTSILLACGPTQTFGLLRQLKTPSADGVWPWPNLVKIKFGSFLGRQVGQARWSEFLQDLSELVELRKNLQGVSPISVHNHSDNLVEDILGCPMFMP